MTVTTQKMTYTVSGLSDRFTFPQRQQPPGTCMNYAHPSVMFIFHQSCDPKVEESDNMSQKANKQRRRLHLPALSQCCRARVCQLSPPNVLTAETPWRTSTRRLQAGCSRTGHDDDRAWGTLDRFCHQRLLWLSDAAAFLMRWILLPASV